ncbi:hypothetical protein pipiens_010284, partial [Culex pipiens pipiens]
VLRNDEHTTLTVDGVSQSRTSRGKEFLFGKFATNSDVFVGGMPNWYNSKLALLALPSVIFEPRFRGSVRNLVYSDQPGVSPRRQEMRQPRDIKCGDSPCDLTAIPREKVTRSVKPQRVSWEEDLDQHNKHMHHLHLHKHQIAPPPAQNQQLSTGSSTASQDGAADEAVQDTRDAQFSGIYPPNYDLVHNCIRTLPSDKGLRSNVTDACERHDPCQHGGICISTDSGPICECRNLEYEGPYCERGK